MNVNPLSNELIRLAIRQIKRVKAGGPDNIPDRALESDIQVTTNMLHVLFRRILEEEQVLMNWNEGYFMKLP
ncbi:unnamed protein product [Schistosoma curassoni]|uniref:Rop family plasmid primer RNA-binding protein n=1 Tax=Schistosoma curassoni TaxID=6186 RepID=A0A183L1A4_9TREM|nr:unnamed protein product [Schistosoma curassoni]